MAERPEPPYLAPPWALCAILGSIIGAACMWFLMVGGITKSPNITYTDLAAVMLAAATIVLTFIGLAIAGAAWYGYLEFKKRTTVIAERKAEVVATAKAEAEVKAYLDAKLDPEIRNRVITIAGQILTQSNPPIIRAVAAATLDPVTSVAEATVTDGENTNAAVAAAAEERLQGETLADIDAADDAFVAEEDASGEQTQDDDS